MPITSDLDLVRLEIGDTDVTPDSDALFSDEEIQVKIDYRTTVNSAGGTVVDHLAAAADLCDILATRFARQFDFAEDGQRFNLSQRFAAYSARARDLRLRSGSGNSSVPLVSSVHTAQGDNISGYGGTIQ